PRAPVLLGRRALLRGRDAGPAGGRDRPGGAVRAAAGPGHRRAAGAPWHPGAARVRRRAGPVGGRRPLLTDGPTGIGPRYRLRLSSGVLPSTLVICTAASWSRGIHVPVS